LVAGALLVATVAAGAGQVPFERIREAAAEPGSWLTYSGTYDSHRFSSLDQIDRSNAKDLQVRWVYQMSGPGLVETTPIVADSVMYITEPPTKVTALDLRTGRKLWSWAAELPRELRNIGFPRVNRGVRWMPARGRYGGRRRWPTTPRVTP
jgi:glucose dehydrogenase